MPNRHSIVRKTQPVLKKILTFRMANELCDCFIKIDLSMSRSLVFKTLIFNTTAEYYSELKTFYGQRLLNYLCHCPHLMIIIISVKQFLINLLILYSVSFF